jgi:hypothetical protein
MAGPGPGRFPGLAAKHVAALKSDKLARKFQKVHTLWAEKFGLPACRSCRFSAAWTPQSRGGRGEAERGGHCALSHGRRAVGQRKARVRRAGPPPCIALDSLLAARASQSGALA